MKKYEYKYISIWEEPEKIIQKLNDYGKDGWELVCVWNTWHYFKRPIE
ncbi:hypothetical protein [Romboutsia sp.]|nr:hypothetical protein [Romboutsia sp.]HSQ88871.1 hypothetical protein [Romboutsia sp.]